MICKIGFVRIGADVFPPNSALGADSHAER